MSIRRNICYTKNRSVSTYHNKTVEIKGFIYLRLSHTFGLSEGIDLMEEFKD